MTRSESSYAVIALGSNQGESAELIERAIDRIATFGIASGLRSSLWETTPVDCPPGSPIFLNAIVAIQPAPAETPESLLGKLQGMERELGRRPKQVMNEPRPIDLDLISFGQQTRATAELIVPHPRAHLRKFVLVPLVEILPQFVAPGWSGTAKTLLHALESDSNNDDTCKRRLK